jgi:hypothetical protein
MRSITGDLDFSAGLPADCAQSPIHVPGASSVHDVWLPGSNGDWGSTDELQIQSEGVSDSHHDVEGWIGLARLDRCDERS